MKSVFFLARPFQVRTMFLMALLVSGVFFVGTESVEAGSCSDTSEGRALCTTTCEAGDQVHVQGVTTAAVGAMASCNTSMAACSAAPACTASSLYGALSGGEMACMAGDPPAAGQQRRAVLETTVSCWTTANGPALPIPTNTPVASPLALSAVASAMLAMTMLVARRRRMSAGI